MKDILFFDVLITPKIINFVYWILIIGVIASSLGIMFGAGRFFSGLVALIGGIIGVRIFCELTIVLFKINENLKTIASK